jgi:hypothetical protein
MPHRLVRPIIALLAVWSGLAMPAHAQTWQSAPPVVAQLGIVAITCKGEFCLGLSCRAGRAELVSIAPGGGPFVGSARISVAGMDASVQFVEDPAIMDALNMLGTRGAAPAGLLARLAEAREVSLSGPTFSDRVAATFSLNGYGNLAPAIRRACPTG